MTKVCSQCGEEKELSEYYIIANKKKGTQYVKSECKKCSNARTVRNNKRYRAENKDRVNAMRRKYYMKRMQNDLVRERVNNGQVLRYPRYTAKRLFRNAQIRAEKNNLPFTITLDDIIIPEYCPILNIKIEQGVKGDYECSPSLDRIDNTKGYVKGNIAVISSKANTMKNSATLEQLRLFSINILTYIGDDIVRPVENTNLLKQGIKSLCDNIKTNADVIKDVLRTLYRIKMSDIKWDNVKIILAVYDENRSEVPDEIAEEWRQITEATMVQCAEKVLTKVPIVAECTITDAWEK